MIYVCRGKIVNFGEFSYTDYSDSVTHSNPIPGTYRNSYFLSHPLYCYTDNGRLLFRLLPMYAQCCGMREIGNIDEFNVQLVKEQLEWLATNYFTSIGCYTYTEVFGDKEMEYPVYPYVTKMLKEWGGVSYGALWYNPNSSNWVRQVTLPVNQHFYKLRQEEHEEEDDFA
jgi:hypothetical protein